MKRLTINAFAILLAATYRRNEICVVEAFAPHGTLRPAFRTLPSTSKAKLPMRHVPSLLRSTTLEQTETRDTKLINGNMTDSELPLLSEIDPSYNDESRQISSDAIQVKKEDSNNKILELAGLGTWIAGLSSFLLVNNFVGPWPANLLQSIPVEYFGLTHALAGMLFGGGIILTTFIEWLASASKNASVLKFWFGKVPALDSLVVLPALTASIVSGVGLAVDHYDSLAQSPIHVTGAISTLLAFAVWWAVTDLTTQSAATEAIAEWSQGDTENTDIPSVVNLRRISNVVSCLFVAAIYAIMVLKPGYSP